MPPKGSKKNKTHRMDAAIAALTPLGFSKMLIRDVVRKLIKEYGDNDSGWYFVEEDYYKLAVDKIIERQQREKEEEDEALAQSKATEPVEETIRITESDEEAPLALEVSSSRGKEPAIEESSSEGDPTEPVEETITITDSDEEAPLAHEVSSSKGKEPAIEESSSEGDPTNSEECYDKDPGLKPSTAKAPSVPKRRPCYGWISDEE